MKKYSDVEITAITVKVVNGKVLFIHDTNSDFYVDSDVKLINWDDEESNQLENEIIERMKELSYRHPQTTFTYTVE